MNVIIFRAIYYLQAALSCSIIAGDFLAQSLSLLERHRDVHHVVTTLKEDRRIINRISDVMCKLTFRLSAP